MLITPFFSRDAIAINEARLKHLASLRLPMCGNRVYEPGCGIGMLTGYWEATYCASVYSTDARQENVDLNLKLHPWRKGKVGVENSLDVPVVPDADVVSCYGLLYHTASPATVIQNMYMVAGHYLIMETVVSNVDNNDEGLVQEWPTGVDQGLSGIGCRPGRDWIMTELRRWFNHVYVTVTQPDHDQFPLRWPAPDGALTRAVFVASHKPLDHLPTLTKRLPTEQVRHDAS